MELFGAIGISDYGWSLLIEADNENDALEWGNSVAYAYDQAIGLQPCGERLSRKAIEENGDVKAISMGQLNTDNILQCKYGEMPEFK